MSLDLASVLRDNAHRIGHLAMSFVDHSVVGPTFQVSLKVRGGTGYLIEHDPDPGQAILRLLGPVVKPLADDLEDIL